MNTFRIGPRRKRVGIVVLVLAIVLGATQGARAIGQGTILAILIESYIDRTTNAFGNYFVPTRAQVARDKAITEREVDEIGTKGKANRQASANIPLPAIGEVTLTNQADVNVASLASGAHGELTFRFVDPATGLPVTGPAVGSVRYEAISIVTDTSTLADFTLLGVSNDLLTGFSLPFTAPPPVSLLESTIGFESFIRAIPLDLNGNPITIPGPEDEDAAIGLLANISPANVVPEPSAWIIVCTGAVAVSASWGFRRMRGPDARHSGSDLSTEVISRESSGDINPNILMY